MAAAIPWITAASAVAGVGLSVDASNKARAAQKEQAKAQAFQAAKAQRIADIKAQRERVKLVRQKRAAVAEQQNRQSASGVSTSTTSGAIGSIASQTASSMSAGDRITKLASEASIFNQQASANAQGFMNSAGTSQNAADIFAAAGTVASIFKKT